MFIRLVAILTASALAFAGCSMMEQYHFPVTQDKVPVEVIVAYGDTHPNEVIKEIIEQKMFDGSIQYKLLIADSKNVTRTVAFKSDGTPVPHPL